MLVAIAFDKSRPWTQKL